MRIYICGAMTGLPEFNQPAFIEAADSLSAKGLRPVNPGRNYDPEYSYTWEQYVKWALIDMLECDGVALLPGCQNSRGATLEIFVATQLGMDVKPLAEWLV